MQTEEFFKRYANTPLDQRMTPLSFADSGLMTLNDIYKQVEILQDHKRLAETQAQHLMDMAEKFMPPI